MACGHESPFLSGGVFASEQDLFAALDGVDLTEDRFDDGFTAGVAGPGLVRSLRAMRCLTVASWGIRPRGAAAGVSLCLSLPVAINASIRRASAAVTFSSEK